MPIAGIPFTDAEIFPIVNITLVAHALLVIAPKHKLVQAFVALVTALMAVIYIGCMINIFRTSPDFTFEKMGTHAGVAELFKLEQTVLPAWVHYIAFDLWTSRWIALDAHSRGFPKLLLAPCVFLTLMLGPVGWLLYMLLRGNWRAKTKAE